MIMIFSVKGFFVHPKLSQIMLLQNLCKMADFSNITGMTISSPMFPKTDSFDLISKRSRDMNRGNTLLPSKLSSDDMHNIEIFGHSSFRSFQEVKNAP